MGLRRLAIACGAGLTALLGIAALALTLSVYRPQLLRPWLERAMAPRGGTASLSNIEVSLSPPSLTLSGLAIVPPPSSEGDLLRVDQLRVVLIPGRFFLGGPWVRRLDARGVLYERPRPRKTEGPPDLTPILRLFDIENLSLTDARLRVAIPQGNIEVGGLQMSMVPGDNGVRSFKGSGELTFHDKGRPAVAGSISANGYVTSDPAFTIDIISENGRLDLQWISGDLSGRARLRVTRNDFRVEDLVLSLPRGRVNPGSRETIILKPIRLSVAAGGSLDGRNPSLEVRGLDIGGLLVASGRLGGPTIDTISGVLDGEFPRLERLKPFIAPILPGTLAGMELTGRLPWRASLSGGITEGVLALELLPPEMGISLANAGLLGRFGGSLKATARLDEWRYGKATLSGRIRGTARLDRPPFSLHNVLFDTAVAGETVAPSLPGWTLSAEQGNVRYKGRSLPMGRVEIRGSAEPAANSYRLEGVEIRSGSLGRLTGRAVFSGGIVTGAMDGEKLPVDNLVNLAAVIGGFDGKKWSPSGAIDIAVQLDPAQGGSRLAAKATVGQFSFQTLDGNTMGQLLGGTIALEADLVTRPRVKIDLALQCGEALWGTVYLDFAKDPLNLRVGGIRTGSDEYEELLLEGGSSGFGHLEIGGKARRERGGWRHQGRLVLRDTHLGPVFRTFLRDPLASSNPDLAGLEMEGSSRIDLSFSGTGKAADLNGRVRLHLEGLHRGGDPPFLLGLDVDLPVSYSLGAANPRLPAPAEDGRWGRIRLKSVRLSGQELGPLDLPAILVPNTLHLGGAIRGSMYGANLSLRRIQADDPLSGDFRIRMTAELDGIDASRFAGSIPIEGHLGGVLDPVIIGPEQLTAAGELAGDLFGGRLGIRHVTVEHPFTTGREIGADVNVDRIDLERLSAALGVGRITGRLSGSMEGLRVAYGQPVAFHMKMASVPSKGVPQSVSLKAVNSISLMSSGSSLSGLGIRMMTTFFREFPYEKIGFECGLKNDVFTVRGLIHEDGVEYLVKRRFFAGINVINGNPDNRIGFSDMLERAKRVTGERSD